MKNTLHFLRVIPVFGLVLLGHALHAQVTGTVFRDFNGNGTRDTNEPLISGITVNAYLANGTTPCGTAVTSGSATPNYSVAGCGTAAVRVEFVLPTTGFCANSGVDFTSFAGSGNGTSVQFANGNSTNVNFAIHNPSDYNTGTTGVNVFIPCYISGDPLVSGAAANGDWFVGYPYTNSGPTGTGTGAGTPPSQKVNGAIIGPTWGVAYSKQAKKVFTSALLKRHVGLGKLGSGGIYMLTPTTTSFTVTEFYDMDASAASRTRADATAPPYGEGTGKSYSIAADNSTITYLGANDPLTGKPSGLGVIGTNAQRGLTANPLDPSYDPAAFDQIGKVGLGDIDISDDGKFLFVMNLYSRKVFRLELNDASNPTSVVNITSYDVPVTTCTNGTYRPWALKFFRNKLYVGVVCSAENAGTTANLNASVYELTNPTAVATFNTTALITLPLDYTKPGDYNPWNNNSGVSTGIKYATPILSDIEFTENGDMLLGIMDRSGHQWGEDNYNFLKTQTTSESVSTSGDILIAGFNCNTGVYTLENNGTVTSAIGTVLTGSSNTNEGPGGKEFFNDNSSVDPHDETATGALAVLKGQGEVVSSAYAQNKNSGDAGTMKLSTTNGAFKSNYQLYYRGSAPGILAKANGLGDVELSGVEAPIEIGNRVWNDTDSDGIQDAGETGISGVSVSLCTGAGAPIATATTDGNGNYYFSSASGTNTPNAIYGIAGLTANTAYQVKFPTTNSGKAITVTKAGSNSAIDSDAPTTGIVAFTTGTFGANNHTFDIGYSTAVCSLTATVTPTACVPATNAYSVTGTIGLTNNTAGGVATVVDGARSTTVTVAAAATAVAYSLTGLTSGTGSHTVTVTLAGCGSAVATYSAPASCTVAPCPSVSGCCATNLLQNGSFETWSGGNPSSDYPGVTFGDDGTGFVLNNWSTAVSQPPFGPSIAKAKCSQPGPGYYNSVDGSSFVIGYNGTNSGSFLLTGVSQSFSVTAGLSYSVCFYMAPGAKANTSGQCVDVPTSGGWSVSVTTGGTTLATQDFAINPADINPTLNVSAGQTNPVNWTKQTFTFTATTTGNVTLAYLPFNPEGATKLGAYFLDNVSVCEGLAICKLVATATPTICNSATNQYTVSGSISLTGNTAGGTATITDGARSTTVTVGASASSVAYSLTGLTSNGASHTVTVSLAGCGSAVVVYAAPASCTVAPPALAVVVGTPICNTATNNYTTTATVSLTNAPAGTLTLTDNGTVVGTVSVTAGQTSASFTLSGVSGSSPASRSVVATLTNGVTVTVSTTYSVPPSCTVCSLSLTTSMLANGQIGAAYSETLTTAGGTTPVSYTISSGSLPAGLTLNLTTGVISGTPTAPAGTASFTVKVTDSKNCTAIAPLTITTSAEPVCELTATATPGLCQSATNTYTVTGTVSATNAGTNSPQTLTVSVNGTSTVVTLTGNGPVSYTLADLTSDGLVKTVSVVSSATACGMTSVTYAAPVSCTVAPPALAVVVGTPICNTATNNYTTTGTVSLSNAPAGTLTITDNGTTVAVVSVTAGQTSASFSVSGVSGSSPAAHTVVATLSNGLTVVASTTYATPASCTVCSLSLTTSMLSNGQIGTAYSETLTTSGATAPVTYTISAGSLPAGLALNPTTGVISGTPTAPAGTASFTVKVTDSKNCTAVAPLTITTSSLPVCSLVATATPGVCNSATNQYAVTGIVSATNAGANSPQTLTVSMNGTSTVVTLTGNGPVSYTLAGLNSDGLTKTISVVSSASACGMASVTYAAPASCTVAGCLLTATATPTVCNTATNTYSVAGDILLTNNLLGGTASVSDGTTTRLITVAASATSVAYSLTGLASGTGSHTVTVSLTGCGSAVAIYSAPASCSVASTPPALAVVVGTPICNTATNNYMTTATVSLTNAPAGTLTVRDNSAVVGTVSVTAGQTTVTFTVTGVSGSSPASHSVVATLANGVTVVASTSYATPASCTVCSLSLTTSMLANGQIDAAYSQTLTTSGGTAPLSYTISAGSLPAGLSLNPTTGVISGTPTAPAGTASFTVKVTDSKNCSAIAPLTITTSALPVCSLVATATPGVCQSATNTYILTGTVSATNAGANNPQTLTISVNGTRTVVTLTGNGPVSYTLIGLPSDGLTKTVSVLSSASACGMASVTYSAPSSCSVAPSFDVIKLVSKAKAKLGEVISYTVILVNTGPVAATSIIVSDSFSAGLSLVPGSISTSAGSFTPGLQGGTWAIASLPAGGTATLIYSASIIAEGVIFNTATIPGDRAEVCTSVPFSVCKGVPFAIELNAPAGYSRYQWYYTAPGSATAVLVADGTLNSYTATMPGEFRAVGDEGISGSCPGLSCCPILIEEIEVPLYTATGKNPTCVGTTPQTNGQITLAGLGADPTEYFYQVSPGSSFSASTAVPSSPTPVSADGVVGTTLAAGIYTIRVWVLVDGQPSCPRDVVVVLVANCTCPPAVCIPISVRKITRVTGQ